MKNKSVFWLLSLTWGCIMTAVGLSAALALMLTGKKPSVFCGTIHFTLKTRFGGLSLGPVIITDSKAEHKTLIHEFGHSVQNCLFGVFMPFTVGIPSAVRYWYFRYCRKKGKRTPPYSAAWFERSADRLGAYQAEKWGM